MKAALFILLLSATATFATPSNDTVRRAQAIATEIIPHFRLNDETFEEALSAIRRVWDERHPNDSFPVALTDYGPPGDPREANPAKITLDLKDITFLEALRDIGLLSGRNLHSLSGLVQLERHSWIEEDWITREHNISPAALAALHLEPDSSNTDLRRAFQDFGVKLEDWMKLALSHSGQKLIVLSNPDQQEQIEGILFLLGNGFRITK
jgi:hypothetical protein